MMAVRKNESADNEIFSLIVDELLTSFPEPLVFFNKTGKVIHSNASAVESLGFDPTGKGSKAISMMIDLEKDIDSGITGPGGDAGPPRANSWMDLFRDKRPVRNLYYRFHRPDGQARRTLVSSAPVAYSGNVIGAVVSWLDITEQVERENFILMARDSLELELEERTLLLSEARRKLEHARRLSDIGALAATVAHELRNPLGVIRTAVYNLRRKNRAPDLNRHIDNIDRKVDESSTIIDNLLNYSRIKNPEIRPVPLYDVLLECIKSAKKRHRGSPVKMHRRLKSIKDKEVPGDIQQIREVFDNLLNNAVEAIEDEGSVLVQAVVDDGRSVRVDVSDDGAGISDTALDSVFDPFFTDKPGGTGLGLAICSKLVELHSGSISIRSERGTGTVVSVVLPLGKERDARKKAPDHRG